MLIEQQLRCYVWSESSELLDVDCRDIERHCEKDGYVVGVAVDSNYLDESGQRCFGSRYIMPYERYCYDTTSDNNGAGYKETDGYRYLICLPADHSLFI